jgi:hypothetical protein
MENISKASIVHIKLNLLFCVWFADAWTVALFGGAA